MHHCTFLQIARVTQSGAIWHIVENAQHDTRINMQLQQTGRKERLARAVFHTTDRLTTQLRWPGPKQKIRTVSNSHNYDQHAMHIRKSISRVGLCRLEPAATEVLVVAMLNWMPPAYVASMRSRQHGHPQLHCVLINSDFHSFSKYSLVWRALYAIVWFCIRCMLVHMKDRYKSHTQPHYMRRTACGYWLR